MFSNLENELMAIGSLLSFLLHEGQTFGMYRIFTHSLYYLLQWQLSQFSHGWVSWDVQLSVLKLRPYDSVILIIIFTHKIL